MHLKSISFSLAILHRNPDPIAYPISSSFIGVKLLRLIRVAIIIILFILDFFAFSFIRSFTIAFSLSIRQHGNNPERLSHTILPSQAYSTNNSYYTQTTPPNAR